MFKSNRIKRCEVDQENNMKDNKQYGWFQIRHRVDRRPIWFDGASFIKLTFNSTHSVIFLISVHFI